MKACKKYLIFFLIISSQMTFGQTSDRFITNYYARKNYFPEKAKEFKEIEGSPYLNSEFIDGVFYLKDTTAVKILLRYNIYTDEMEYQSNGVNYAVGNPLYLNKILLGESVFVYLPFIQKGGYFELFEVGKCTLVQKKLIYIKPAEEPKAMQSTYIPAKFIRKPDIFYMLVNDTLVFKIDNMKSIKKALQDQQLKIDSFIKQEKIKNTKQENLIKIVKYYNSL
jgi:hypothetical protein